jgi:hypothetical protein
MCFSAMASFGTAAFLASFSAKTCSLVRDRTEIPLALFPSLFASQQFAEGLVWQSLAGRLEPLPATPAIYLFVVFAYLFWPIWAPYAVRQCEPDPVHRRALLFIQGIGGLVAGAFSFLILAHPPAALVVEHSIQYTIEIPHPLWMQGAYGMATALACLASSHRAVRIFGVGIALSFFLAWTFHPNSFPSVWCFFAAILSLVLYAHFHIRAKEPLAARHA